MATRPIGVVVVSVLVQLGLHHLPLTQRLFQLGDLSLGDCALALLVGLLAVNAARPGVGVNEYM